TPPWPSTRERVPRCSARYALPRSHRCGPWRSGLVRARFFNGLLSSTREMEEDLADAPDRSFFGPGLRKDEIIAGRYSVVAELGTGGMGQVVEVEHLDLEKRFALKLIRPDRWDAALDARFRREARSLARVASPR